MTAQHRPFSFLLLLLGTLLYAAPALAQTVIIPSQGVDSRVDYEELRNYGPWDDRNYQLTQEDVALLADDEASLRDLIPAFFRVEMRRANPALQQPGVRYPRSAYNIFKQMYGGYLYRGQIYRKVRRNEQGRLELMLEGGVPEEEFADHLRALEGEVRVTSPVGAAESAIKIHPTNPDIVVAGSNGPGGGQRMHYSTDGGSTWTQSSLPLGGTCCDPTIDYKSDGSLVHTSTLGNCVFSGCAIWTYRSGDGGVTWNDLEDQTPGDPRRELTTTGSDKEFLHVDKHAGSPFKDNAYLTWHDGNVMQFARSTDDGNTWTVTNTGQGSSIGSDIVTDKLGRVFHVWANFSQRDIRFQRSDDGGATLGTANTIAGTNASFIFPVPAMDTREVFVYPTADADLSDGPYANSVYVAWTDSTAPTGGTPVNNHARIQVAFSRDGGTTWNVTTPHETADAAIVDRFHQWLAVGPDGSVHVVFYDTRVGLRSATDLFYAVSEDGAQTWSAPSRLTSVTSAKINDGFEYGDYNGLDAVLDRVIAVYTDNRNEGGGGGDSVDVYAIGQTVDSAAIFSDGFESGDTSLWTSSSP